MNGSRLGRRLTLVLVIFAVGLLLRPRTAPAPAQTRPAAGEGHATAVPAAAIVGSASCSAASCHGGIEPRHGATTSHNEFTLWSSRDPHVNAYAVLHNARSRRMGELLGVKPAEDPLCLACHTHPAAAVMQGDPGLRALIAAERQVGVGCEACHGGADRWLVEHTRPSWQTLAAAEKARLGMVPVEDMASLFRSCAGCHVGAPPESVDSLPGGFPVRDVTHDLIAAGHPRLAFEPSAFLANLPPHWQVDRPARKRRSEGQLWALGQVAAAQQTLKLTRDRIERREASWPELAEFSCFACHHDLEGKSWRQERDVKSPGRLPAGSVPWAPWAWVGPRWLAGVESLRVPEIGPRSTEAAVALGNPWRAGKWKQIAPRLAELDTSLEALLTRIHRDWTPETPLHVARALKAADWPRKRADWDDAEQVYLGLTALAQDLKARAPTLNSRLAAEFADLRALPKGFDSPRVFRPADFFNKLDLLLSTLE